MDDPYAMLAQAELFDEPKRQALEDYIAKLNNEAESRNQQEAKAALDAASVAMVTATEHYFFEPSPVIQPARAALSFEMPGIPPAGAIPGWFVGDY